MHWINNQLTVFTCVAWGFETHAFTIISDDLQHGKDAVLIFMDLRLDEMGAWTDTYDEVIVFSDGAVGQFKNRYVMRAVQVLSMKHSKQMRWDFFASSHGKGAVDGIGAEVKRIVWDCVRSKKMEVTCLDEFVRCAKERTHKIKVCTEYLLFKLG
jgi:hypothetical protein